MSTITETKTSLPAGTWNVDPVHSQIGFAVEYVVGTFRGSFSPLEAKLEVGEDGSATLTGATGPEGTRIGDPGSGTGTSRGSTGATPSGGAACAGTPKPHLPARAVASRVRRRRPQPCGPGAAPTSRSWRLWCSAWPGSRWRPSRCSASGA